MLESGLSAVAPVASARAGSGRPGEAEDGVDPELLRRFPLLAGLGDAALLRAASDSELVECESGTLILRRGDTDPWSLFLLEGVLELEAADGVRRRLSADSEQARMPVSQLRPRQFSVYAGSRVRYLKVDDAALGNRTRGMVESQVEGFEVEELEAEPWSDEAFLGWLAEELAGGGPRLESPPRLALRLRSIISGAMLEPRAMARLVSHDPVLTLKLMADANAAAEADEGPVESCTAAIERLGARKARESVDRYALRETFETRSRWPAQRMVEFWRHSHEVGSTCFVLARIGKVLGPEKALVAGLLHDIGVVPVLMRMRDFPALANDPHEADATIERLKARAGEMMLRRWGFSDAFVDVARDAEKWIRERDDDEADYADVVIVAQVHGMLGLKGHQDVPALSRLPSFARLQLEQFTPETSLRVINAARAKTAKAWSLLGR